MLDKSAIKRYLKNAKDAPTREELEEWLLKADSKEVDQLLKTVWKEYSGSHTLPIEEKRRILLEVKGKIGMRMKTGKKLYLFMQRAAAILFIPLLVFTALYVIHQFTGDREKVVTYAPAGQQAVVLLPDGSEVILNNCSKLEYTKDYGERQRPLYLDGEAFFNVAKNKKRFIVQTEGIAVEVLGTRFNVSAFSNDNSIITTLEEGSIRISGGFPGKNSLLKPGEQAVFNKKGKSLEVKKVKPKDYITWKEGELNFINEHFTQIAIKLERRFGVKITIESQELYSGDHRYTGSFKEETLTQILDAIKLTTPINYEIVNDNEIVLKYILE